MDFAKKQLEKYGWSEGKGLGKNESGIKSALKPEIKLNTNGIGYDIGSEFTNNWWEHIYTKAAQNIEVNNGNDEVTVRRVSSKPIEITDKNYAIDDLCNAETKYKNFFKSGEIPLEVDDKCDRKALSDSELFEICNGRTAHKGARHGIKSSGKLYRLERQEKILIKQLQKCSISDNESLLRFEQRVKKLQQVKVKSESIGEPQQPVKKKKRKKKRKSVSFNSTVTEYHHHECDLSSLSNDSVDPPIVIETVIKDKSELLDEIVDDDDDDDDDVEQLKRKVDSMIVEDDLQVNKRLCLDATLKKRKKNKKKKKARREKRDIANMANNMNLVCTINDDAVQN